MLALSVEECVFLSWLVPTLIIAAMVAAIVFRRRMKDPQNPLGVWLSENLRSRMAFAAKMVAYLTLAAWILIFAFAPKDERGSVDDLLQSFRKAIGLEETQASPPIPPPFRIPGPGETAKPVSGRP